MFVGQGGAVIAVKNLDGDVFSEIVANGFGCRNLMMNKLVGRNEEVLFEPHHGTVSRHFADWQRGKKAYSNPVATIICWAEALKHLAIMDQNPDLTSFSHQLE